MIPSDPPSTSLCPLAACPTYPAHVHTCTRPPGQPAWHLATVPVTWNPTVPHTKPRNPTEDPKARPPHRASPKSLPHTRLPTENPKRHSLHTTQAAQKTSQNAWPPTEPGNPMEHPGSAATHNPGTPQSIPKTKPFTTPQTTPQSMTPQPEHPQSTAPQLGHPTEHSQSTATPQITP